MKKLGDCYQFFKKILVSIFFILLMLCTISIPIFFYILGSMKEISFFSKFFVLILLFMVIWGWMLCIKKIIEEYSAKSFDLGLGWAQYINSEHFLKILNILKIFYFR